MSRLSNNPPPNPPHRHHYIPSFYLSRWATGHDGRLCQYSRPHNRVVRNRRHPTATGFADKLYELRGLEDDLANAVETKFFSPVDNAAADALALMEAEGNRARWDSRRRTGWAVFLHSLLLRAPEDVSAFKETWRYLMNADELRQWEERYQEIRKPGDAATFQEHMANLPADTHDRSAMNALVSMIDGGNVARKIHHMLWHVIDTSDADFDFLTSDRPILAMSHRQSLRECNRQTCGYAVKYVYGVDDSQLSFVIKHFATKDQPRLAQASAKQRQDMAATILVPPKSPRSSPQA